MSANRLSFVTVPVSKGESSSDLVWLARSRSRLGGIFHGLQANLAVQTDALAPLDSPLCLTSPFMQTGSEWLLDLKIIAIVIMMMIVTSESDAPGQCGALLRQPPDSLRLRSMENGPVLSWN